MNTTQRIYTRDFILNAFRRREPHQNTGVIDIGITDLWNEQAASTKQRIAERDFLSVIGDLVAIGKIGRFAGFLTISPDEPELSQPDFHTFCNAVIGLEGDEDGRYAVVSYNFREDLKPPKDIWALTLFQTKEEASAHAQKLSDETRTANYHACLDLLHPKLGIRCDLNGLFWENWSLGERSSVHCEVSGGTR